MLKVALTVVKHYAMHIYSGTTAPPFLSGQLHVPAALPPGKNCMCPIFGLDVRS
jgi:hypothetical protein